MKIHLLWLWNGTEGQDLTEYALLLSLVALAAIASMKMLGGAINNLFSSAIANLSTPQ